MIAKKIRRFEPGKIGSALIMTVVLTVLLAIVAVMFVLIARMDSAATSNIADNKMLDSSVKSIIEIISKELVLDTPGVAGREYYDYPDTNNAWLASLEPYLDRIDGTYEVYKWRQISDITGYLSSKRFATQYVNVDPVYGSAPFNQDVIKEYPPIGLDTNNELDAGSTKDGLNNNELRGQVADADGDGILDSKWFELTDLRTSKGRPIYAAVRVIDNSGMINVDTAYSFDAGSSDANKIDGSSQMQVNLEGVLKTVDNIDNLHNARCGTAPGDWGSFSQNVIWQYGLPNGNYLPFDISDELELRYRFCIDGRIKARIEGPNSLSKTIRGRGTPDFGNLYNTDSDWGLYDWNIRITDPNDPYADRRHLLTTLNLDRIIDPNGSRMFNIITDTNAQELYNRLEACIDVNTLNPQEVIDAHAYLAQFAANVVDRSDDDTNVTVVVDKNGNKFYGMERPYIYISEVARNFAIGNYWDDFNEPPTVSTVVHRSYAIELFKEFETDEVFDPWQLEISSPNKPTIIIDANIFADRGGKFYVIIFEDGDIRQYTTLSDKVKFFDSPGNGATGVDPAIRLSWAQFFLGYDSGGNPIMSNSYDFYIGMNEDAVKNATVPDYFGPGQNYDPVLVQNTQYFWRVDGRNDANGLSRKGPVQSFTTWLAEPNSVYENIRDSNFILGKDTVISLYRPVQGAPGNRILVDKIDNLPRWLTDESDPSPIGGYGVKSFQRDIGLQNRLKRLWDIGGTAFLNSINTGTLGAWNLFSDMPAAVNNPIQPWYYRFRNVGDAAMMFIKSTYLEGSPLYQIPSGLPIITEASVRFDINDPTMQNVFKYITVWRPDDPNETRIKGRLNINTAPAFVIRQLPWLSKVNGTDVNIADAIVAYRDKTKVSSMDYSDRSDSVKATGINNIYESPGFRSIGELLNVINTSSSGKEYNIRYCGLDNGDQRGFPDLRTNWDSETDSVNNDLEEEELIFARISDLVTVRSDIFTAYILVRIGTDGPQKRVIAILDRSGVKDTGGRVSVRAFQPVPEAR
jgi:hypothetical protein